MVTVFALVGCDVVESDRPDGPVADFTWKVSDNRSTVEFINLSANANHYEWKFPGGLRSTQIDPVFGFGMAGLHNVTLLAYESGDTPVDSITRKILIKPSRVWIDSVIVEAIPFHDPSRYSWDELTGPDLFYRLMRPNGSSETSSFSHPVNDLTPSQLPVGWKYSGNGFFLNTWDQTYRIEVVDMDDAYATSAQNDLIGEVRFLVSDLIDYHNYPTIVNLNDDSLKVRIVLKWE